MPKKFHLGWFTNFTVDEWNDPFASGGGKPWNGKYYVEMARALERACFDYLMLEDTLMLSDAYGHSTEMYMKKAIMVTEVYGEVKVPRFITIFWQAIRAGCLASAGHPPRPIPLMS